jgi:hypothetical protein
LNTGNIFKRIGRAEYLIKTIRKANGKIKLKISHRGNSREQSRELKKLYDAGETNIDRQKTLISVLRSVGDAVAFIYGDRWDLKQLALKQGAGFVTGKRGTRFERKILRRAFALGATVVMNDLTHTLRQGDITVFRPDLWPEGGSPFFLIEAKSGRGGNKARAKRQETAMKEIHEYLSTDKRSVAGGTFERISVKTFPEYHFEVITKLASNLRHGEVCVEEIEPGLHYILLDCACDTNNMEQVLKRSFCGAARYFMSVNDMKSVRLAYYPFPLSIRDPETLFRFYNGEFVIFISVNIDHVNDVLSPFRLKIEVTRNHERPWQVLPVGKETSTEDGESFIGAPRKIFA